MSNWKPFTGTVSGETKSGSNSPPSSSPVDINRTPVQEETDSNASQLVCSTNSSVQNHYDVKEEDSSSSGASSDETLMPSDPISSDESQVEQLPDPLQEPPLPASSEENEQLENPLEPAVLSEESASQEMSPDTVASVQEDKRLPDATALPKENAPQAKPTSSPEENAQQPDRPALSEDSASEEMPPDAATSSQEIRRPFDSPEEENAPQEPPPDSVEDISIQEEESHLAASTEEPNPLVCSDHYEEVVCRFESKEVNKKLSKIKFLEGGNKGHTWHHTIPVKIKGKDAHVALHLFPRVSGQSHREKAMLDVAVEVPQKLRQLLCEVNATKCEVKVKTKVLDKTAGQNLGCTQFRYYPICMNDGKVNYRQELADCAKVKHCQSDSVCLVVKINIKTSQFHSFLVINMPTALNKK